VGTQLKISGGEVESQEACVTSRGTAFKVKNLFFNIPARRNFLKSDAVETRHIIDEFQRVALAHPNVSFSFHHNSSELFQLPATNLRQRIVNIFGGKTNEKLVPVQEETEIAKIEGFVGKPEFAKRTKGEQFFFVNNRFIKSNYLNHAVKSSFEGLLKDKAYPSYFLCLKIDPKRIDINIHPTKTEIKFDDEHALYSILRSSVKHSLGQFNISPVLDFQKDSGLDTPYDLEHKPAQTPKIDVDRNFNPFEKESRGNAGLAQPEFRQKQSNPGDWKELYADLERKEHSSENFEIESEQVSGKLFSSQEEMGDGPKTFQLHRKYIISSIKTGMLAINQNRAHFRILYERLLKNITDEPALSQQLLFPLKLTFSKPDLELLERMSDSLLQTGFLFEEKEKDEIHITGIPTSIAESEVEQLMTELLSNFENQVPNSGFEKTDLMARSLAKGMAIKSGSQLKASEQVAILNELFACKEPKLSPSNQKIYVILTAEDLDKKFD
jgi:DNA mismatch repair protein MutL